MDASLNAYQKQNRTISEWVWYEGTTALREGAAVCYNYDFTTDGVAATAADGRRVSHVENPSTTNAQWF
ncbi:MAG: hypothetical protein KKD00_07360, partial [Gammaproteobacteria bacterium]|nr:hypothetical protein [Gammaproteobacteria bacterium]